MSYYGKNLMVTFTRRNNQAAHEATAAIPVIQVSMKMDSHLNLTECTIVLEPDSFDNLFKMEINNPKTLEERVAKLEEKEAESEAERLERWQNE